MGYTSTNKHKVGGPIVGDNRGVSKLSNLSAPTDEVIAHILQDHIQQLLRWTEQGTRCWNLSQGNRLKYAYGFIQYGFILDLTN